MMILQLRIQNFAIIEDIQIEFDEGLNVVTGETGAGKSILLDALGVLLGERASTDYIRHGMSKAEIEGLFCIKNDSHVKELLTENAIPIEGDKLCIRREITLQGKSTARINGQIVTTAVLKQIGEALVNFHSQHDHHQLLQVHRHLFWLDAFAGSPLKETLTAYQDKFSQYIQWKKQLEQMNRDEKELAQRIDLLRFQIDEIEEANLEIGEDERLQEEKTKLEHAEKILSNVYAAYSALADEQRALDWLGICMSHLEEVSALDKDLEHKFQQIEEAFYLLDELTRDLGSYADKNDFDPKQLERIEERLDVIFRLKRKYGDTIEAILNHYAKIKEELVHLENKETYQSDLMEKLIKQKDVLLDLAKQLTKQRKEAAHLLGKRVKTELSELHMEKAEFAVFVDDLSTQMEEDSLDLVGGELGMNEVEFMITTNPGEPLKPLAKVASGGELSRIALALRTVLAEIDEVNTLVFDEVDTGVSGRITQAIGEKLLHISKERQVLAITHHPQVASLAHCHFLIEKKVENQRTKTEVKKLTEEERIDELARMIGGELITETARLHAAEMRRLGKQIMYGQITP